VKEVNHQNFGIKLFSEYVADPSAASFAEPGELLAALEKFPYCQLLHLFYSRTLASRGLAENNDLVARDALIIPDRTILYSIINDPEKLNSKPPIPTDFIEIPDSGEESLEIEEIPVQEDVVIIDEATLTEENQEVQNIKDETSRYEINSEAPSAEQTIEEHITEEVQSKETSLGESADELTKNDEGQLIGNEKISEETLEKSTEDKTEEQKATVRQEPEIKSETERPAKEEPQKANKNPVGQTVKNDSDLIENIFNQLIGAVPPPITPVAVYAVSTPFTDEDFISEPKDFVPGNSRPVPEEKPAEKKNEIVEIKVEEEAEVSAEETLEIKAKEQVEIKAKETIGTKAEEPVEIKAAGILIPVKEPAMPSEGNKTKDSETDQKVSKYDDDKMPYSFLWWLSKTRNEHSDTYQPYVEFKLDTTQTIKRTSVDQLSSQIIENIFHLQSPLEETENAPKTVPFQVRRKEDSILDKFIKEEPQIKPPNSQKLDTENKARKSAEDPNDLVSETLAQIYTDQMLFQKAIDTFKKLSLKFPEKSTYFADQIIELEKKVN